MPLDPLWPIMAAIRARAALGTQEPISATKRRNASKDAYLVADKVFRALLDQHGVAQPTAETRFAQPRRWRFDYSWHQGGARVALEVEGGAWIPGGGRHNRASSFIKEMEKYNVASCLGWRVLRVTPQQLATVETVELIQRALAYGD